MLICNIIYRTRIMRLVLDFNCEQIFAGFEKDIGKRYRLITHEKFESIYRDI